MATYYGLRCRTCDVRSATWVRSDPQRVVELVRAFPVIREALALATTDRLPLFVEVEVHYIGLEDEPPHLFLNEHYQHDLVVYDEYGRDHPGILLDSKPPST